MSFHIFTFKGWANLKKHKLFELEKLISCQRSGIFLPALTVYIKYVDLEQKINMLCKHKTSAFVNVCLKKNTVCHSREGS